MRIFFLAQRGRSRLALLLALAALPVLLAACGSDAEPTNTPTPQSAPISFPYIFSGNFTVAGQPGPVGTRIFTMLNGAQAGSINETVRDGAYSNVLAGPNKPDDIGKTITFHIGDPDGDNVQAEQTMVFNIAASAQFLTLNLTFPEFP